MTGSNRPSAAALATAGVLAIGAALCLAAGAAADPPPVLPVEPPPPPTGVAAVTGVLAQSGVPSDGPLGLPDLSSYGSQLFLGQTAAPALPGSDPGAVPRPNPLNNAYLLPQNAAPAAPGRGQIVGVAPGEENADVSKLDYLHRLWAMYQDGGLTGALLGQQPHDQPAG